MNSHHQTRQHRILLLNNLPQVLLLLVKRFAIEDGLIFKVRTSIDLEFLHFSIGISSQKVNYRIDAVLFHIGDDLFSGHYVCMRRRASGYGWILCDDSRLTYMDSFTAPDNADVHIILATRL